MIRFKYFIMLLLCMLIFLVNTQRNIDFVNPMVGTKCMGHTFPGVCALFGLVQLSPDTGMIPRNLDSLFTMHLPTGNLTLS